MPYLIHNLIENKPEPLAVQVNTSAQEALALMLEYDYSQLPVVEIRQPLGIITNQSILRAINNFGVKLEELRAIDAMVKIATVRPEDDLFDMLSRLQDNNAILIVDGANNLIGIVTNFDTTAYFQRRAEDMMLIEDIEVMIRNIVLSVYTDRDGNLDEKGLNQAGKEVKSRWKTFDRFSMSDYVNIFLHETQWKVYGSNFTLEPEAIKRLLDSVRGTRNHLAHFRGEISAQQRQQLRFCNEWLARYHDQITMPLIDEIDSEDSKEEETFELVDAELSEELSPNDSRYAPLAIWLQSQPADKNIVKPSFAKIEQIIGGELPPSAYKHRAWWANDSVSHPQSQQWLDVDWRVASVNMTTQVVRFTRIQERQKAYIDFYSKLINELQKQPGFDHLQILPDGVNWYWTKSIVVRDRRLSSFNYSFGRGGIFRVELYIDSGDKETNKNLFDALLSQKDEIEQEIGHELTWQRLDNRRASRVAWVFPGHITDSEEELKKLRQKAVPAMVKFSEALFPKVVEINKKSTIE